MSGDDWRALNWQEAVMWYGVGMLPRLRGASFEQLKAIGLQAGEISLENPLHLAGPKPQFTVPLWSLKPLTGGQVTALMVFTLWVMCGEDEGMASGLMNDWGDQLRRACFLARAADGTPQVVEYAEPRPPEPAQKGLFDGLDGNAQAPAVHAPGGRGRPDEWRVPRPRKPRRRSRR